MLTLKQQQTFEYIKHFVQKFQYSPTVAEIARGIGIKSRGVVHRYLKALEIGGFVELLPKRHRNIRIKTSTINSKNLLPLVGAIAAGKPIEAILQEETIDVTNIFLGENRYALRVKGDSMIEEGIYDGDVVVCQRTDTANDGQIVVALIDQFEATLKRIHHNPNKTVTLIPANHQLKPMVYESDRVTIQGIFVGLLRYTG